MEVKLKFLIIFLFSFSSEAMKIANKDQTNYDNVAIPTSSPVITPPKIISTSLGSNELLVGYDCSRN